jgi:hypothetical protein
MKPALRDSGGDRPPGKALASQRSKSSAVGMESLRVPSFHNHRTKTRLSQVESQADLDKSPQVPDHNQSAAATHGLARRQLAGGQTDLAPSWQGCNYIRNLSHEKPPKDA